MTTSKSAGHPSLQTRVAQKILDGLTDIEMPRLPAQRQPHESVAVRDSKVPVRRHHALVVGSGAAGLRAAVELKRRGVEVAIATQSAYGGTSACSGSDKQTLHTANTADRGDNLRALARAIGAGGAMDEDCAYIEAVGSVRALSTLQYLGLPIPQDSLGAVLRYQTDHDEVGRATSCGPRTSRLMVQVLAREALRLEIPIYNRTTAVEILTVERQGQHAAGVLAVADKHRSADNPMGVVALMSDFLVLAAGGPGELYRDSVYPRQCFGSLGLGIEAGLQAVNLTESQFGIGSPRDGFPWNLSGTYAQCMPCIYSVDAQERHHNFLADYYRTTQELASNIFRKGYQWPFHATRMLEFGSSLFDLAVYREMRAGRKVLMDFQRNPLPVSTDAPFDLQRLDPDVRSYLESAGALLPTPIARLRQMNPLSIELYRRYKIDITKDPLEFTMNNQHMNGGLAVDSWARSSLQGCYVVGEAAGTHGVTRPGGAALNAGQVFAMRCAEHIASHGAVSNPAHTHLEAAMLDRALGRIASTLRADSSLTVPEIKREVQTRMSDFAGIVCRPRDVRQALEAAQRLTERIEREGIALRSKAFDVALALQWRHNALASLAVLAALDFYINRGGGSRGARAICSADGDQVPMTRLGPLEEFRFVPERPTDREEQIVVHVLNGRCQLSVRPVRRIDSNQRSFFERDWPDFLTGRIYGDAR